ncbi:hypothetical protein LTR62_008806 [Meristemomyces frigidus]|uniref:Altered inheritance of mitochondria protein 32 n=1 Tax=Meristemomyces frigidus TaxID=1508187 RepID=A0AAN7YCH7_9PEZI|nr:hypothetical protein LTR62_008806 [Meristemomyces frigidus]
MFIFKHGGRRAAAVVFPTTLISSRSFASRIDIPFTAPPVPVIDHCPSPTCQCRASPAGLDIEREQNLNGSMPTYAEQIILSTGRSDWPSRIEEEESKDGAFVRQLKGLLLKGGKYADPYHNVMLTNSSLPPATPPAQDPSSAHEQDDSSIPPASAFLLPSFEYIPSIPSNTQAVETFIKAFILPNQLHKTHDLLSSTQQNLLKRQPQFKKLFSGARKINEILILICGHRARDSRCGTLGPILQAEFEEKLERQNITILRSPPAAEAIEEEKAENRSYKPTARVAQISHIGGHKFAGNVIIYLPPSFTGNALAGKGIWYGRVGPENVEGIVGETVLGGKVIKELFRGGVDQERKFIRL